jgi:CDGSH-type Zn-finger protein
VAEPLPTTGPPAPAISVRPNGPYVVTGGLPLVHKRDVRSEHGEPLTWESVERLDPGPAYALCRCGQSSNKPFCDGTHAKVGFDGEESASGTYAERSKTLGGTGIVVRDDRSLCTHAGFCGNRVTNVWKMVGETDDSVLRGQVMAMIERCPSGALTYRLEGADDDLERDLPAELSLVADGPIWVTGRVPVTRSDGEELERRNRVTLCRCGASTNKPLCDGTHKDIGFSDR